MNRDQDDNDSSSDSEHRNFERKLLDTVRHEEKEQKERLGDQLEKYTAKILLEKHISKTGRSKSKEHEDDYEARKYELERKLQKAVSRENERNISPVIRREREKDEFEREKLDRLLTEITTRRSPPSEWEIYDLADEIHSKVQMKFDKQKEDKHKIDYLLRPRRLTFQHELETDQLYLHRELEANRKEYERDNSSRDEVSDEERDEEREPVAASRTGQVDLVDYAADRNNPSDQLIRGQYSLKKIEPEWNLREKEEQEDKKRKTVGRRKFKEKVREKNYEDWRIRETFRHENRNEPDSSDSDD